MIDIASNTVYVVAATKENGAFYHRLHALDMTSGAEKFGGPRIIQASYPGTAQDGTDGVIDFSSHFQLQRAALLLSKGKVYIAFASNADSGLYHGWVIAYDAISLRQVGAWVSTPNGYQGGIWMSGCGISADADGNLYLSIANGPFDAYGEQPGANFSDSVVKLRPAATELNLADFFTPFSQAKMAKEDLDLGSAGVVLLPDQPGAYPHMAVTSGKNGHIYLLNRDAWADTTRKGQRKSADRAGSFRSTEAADGNARRTGTDGCISAPDRPEQRLDQGFRAAQWKLSKTPVSQTAAIYRLTRSTVSVSANGNGNGIVWAVDTDAYYAARPGAAVLHAYDARNLARELYNSNQRFARDNPGQAAKFTVPTIANGKVFVGAADQVSVYGLLATAGN